MASSNHYDSAFDEDVQQNEYNTCPECSGRVTTNTHETVCDDCGLVLSADHVDLGPDWFDAADSESSRSHVGAPRTPARHDDGLSTEIGRRRDGRGNPLRGATRRRFARLRRQHSWAQTPKKVDTNRVIANTEIRRLCGPGALDLSKGLRDQACVLFRSAHDADLVRGRTIDGMAAASVYAVCRVNGLPRTIDEVAAHSALAPETIAHSYNVLNTELGLPAEPLDPRAFISPIASELGLSPAVRRDATDLLEHAIDTGLGVGCNPAGMAAAALYHVASGTVLTQGALANAANVTTATVRARWYDLRELERTA